MNLRSARRLSKHLYIVGRILIDVSEYLTRNNFNIRWSNSFRYYIIRFHLDGVKYLRANRCPWRLMKIVYNMVSTRHADFEGTLVNEQQQKVLGVLTTVKQQLNPAFPVRSAPNYGKPHVLARRKHCPEMQNIVGAAIEDVYGPNMLYDVKNNWIHSSEVTDPQLIAPGFNKLGLRPPQPLNRKVAAVMLLQQMIRQKKEYGTKKHLVDLTPDMLASADQNRGSAAGIIPVQGVPNIMQKLTGTKGDMHAAAVMVNINNRSRDDIPRSIPYKVFLKSEVIKRGKAVRGIQNESLATYSILSLAEPERPEVRLGNAIGMGGFNKSFASVFVVWYVAYHEITGGHWHQFVEHLAERGAHESDKVGWEASTNITDCLVRLIMLLNEKTFKTPQCKKLYVAAVTDSHFPFVYLHKEQFQCPARVPSGTYFTSKGNTHRHRYMNDWMCYYVMSHGNRLGEPGCDCSGCDIMSGHESFGNEITPLDLALRKRAFILGDDYLSVSWGESNDNFFDTLLDNTFGTETKTEKKEFFEDAEFLRKKFKRGEENTITWYRDPERILAKMYHGDFLHDKKRMAEALTSYKYEAGDNQRLVNCLTKIYEQIDGPETQELDLSKYAAKRPILADVHHFNMFTCDDVVNYQGQFARTVENIFLENKL